MQTVLGTRKRLCIDIQEQVTGPWRVDFLKGTLEARFSQKWTTVDPHRFKAEVDQSTPFQLRLILRSEGPLLTETET